jgi:hypothetical protein
MARSGRLWRPVAGVAAGVAATVMPDAAASAAVIAAATLAVRLHAVTFTIHREREAAVRGRCRPVPGYGPACDRSQVTAQPGGAFQQRIGSSRRGGRGSDSVPLR